MCKAVITIALPISKIGILSRKINKELLYIDKGKKIYYSKPKSWDISSGKFTIQNNTDFVIIGDYTNIEDVNLNEIKNSIDDVFVINQFKTFFDELKHFEIYAN